MPYYLFIKALERRKIKAIRRQFEGLERSPFFRVRLNVSKLPARRIGRSRETKTNEFDQARSKIGSTVFENNRWNSIQTVSLPIIESSETGLSPKGHCILTFFY